MTQDSASATVQHTIVVPAGVPMVSILGAGDELLRVIERAFVDVDLLARGNEITITGPPSGVGVVERLVDQLVTVVRTGQGLTPESVERRSICSLHSRHHHSIWWSAHWDRLVQGWNDDSRPGHGK